MVTQVVVFNIFKRFICIGTITNLMFFVSSIGAGNVNAGNAGGYGQNPGRRY